MKILVIGATGLISKKVTTLLIDLGHEVVKGSSGSGVNIITGEGLKVALQDTEVVIDHSKTKAKSPQTNGICERFHRTIQDEFYAIAFRKKIYCSIVELQADLDNGFYIYAF